MVKLALVIWVGACSAARIKKHALDQGEQHNTTAHEDLASYLQENGHNAITANHAAHVIAKEYTGSSEEDDATRRMKALQFLQIEDLRAKASKTTCADLNHPANQICGGDVNWAFHTGRLESWAGDAYAGLGVYTKTDPSSASIQDFQKLFFCEAPNKDKKCGFPPCSCSHPPCDVCAGGGPGAPAPPPFTMCANLQHSANQRCSGDVSWAYNGGRFESWAGDAYDLPTYTGTTLTSATLDDMQRLYFCSPPSGNAKCGTPPCGCSNPPCDSCKPAMSWDSGLGFEQQCSQHSGCVGNPAGDCCPNANGAMEDCCAFIPPVNPVGPPVFEYNPKVPAEDIVKALNGGEYLGPLTSTRCRSPSRATSFMKDVTMLQCAHLCTKGAQCKMFAYAEANKGCSLYTECTAMEHTNSATEVFVKNVEGMHPQRVPDRTVEGSNFHFLLIGDWGGLSCPGMASMHYVWKQVKAGSERWNIDHNAQVNVAKAMTKVAQEVKPFLVVNAGDNFYWGGVFHNQLGGKGIHDDTSFQRTFENVYSDPSLKVPWLSVLGNHDYGGDGCFANIKAQFDYTIKDMMINDRWKMPSPFYSHKVNFPGFSAEFFMVDTNIEDSKTGRKGGICQQTLCSLYGQTPTIPKADCIEWFDKTWNDQKAWLEGALAGSTAEWKILAGHHKPHGFVGSVFNPMANRYGVQLVVGSHTHEMSFGRQSGHPALLTVGAGGGAQGNSGCGGATYCSSPTGYGFADVEISQDNMIVKIYQWDNELKMTQYLCRNGNIQYNACGR